MQTVQKRAMSTRNAVITVTIGLVLAVPVQTDSISSLTSSESPSDPGVNAAGLPAGGTGGCAAAADFIGRLRTPPSRTRRQQYDTLICGLVASGTWSKLDALYVLAAEDAATALTNLVSSSHALTNHGMMFGPNAGMMGDGSSSYLETDFTPTKAGGNYKLGDASIGIGITDPRQARYNWIGMGAASLNSSADYIDPGNYDGGGCQIQNGNQIINTTVTVYSGAWICTRSGSQLVMYHDGTAVVSDDSEPAELANQPMAIGAVYKKAFVSSGDTYAWAFYGAALNSKDVAVLTSLLAIFPTNLAGVPAARWGFMTNLFTYDFATAGLTGIDVNHTLNPGYSFYTSWWFGCETVCGGGVHRRRHFAIATAWFPLEVRSALRDWRRGVTRAPHSQAVFQM